MTMAALSKSRLARTYQALPGWAERKAIPGVVALVSHDDNVHVETHDTMSIAHPAPMKCAALISYH